MRACRWTRHLMIMVVIGSSAGMASTALSEPCTPAVGCAEPGQSCRQEQGVCDPGAPGACLSRPAFCPTIYDPVCGCDGETYDNDCTAYAAGVNVDYLGVCGPPAGEAVTKDVLLCHIAPGDPEDRSLKLVARTAVPAHLAHGDLVGACPGRSSDSGTLIQGAECVLLETDRAFPYMLVLENHRGYKTADRVSAAGTWTPDCPDICSEGQACLLDNTIKTLEEPCLPEVGCAELDQACLQGVGTCGIDQPGVCVELPGSCKRIDNPVCGCDFRRYDNPCMAVLAGVGVYSLGGCPGEPCLPRIGCPQGQYCSQEPGVCDADAPGTCWEPPELCDATYDPVCGCDGQTYGNGCTAAAAGVNVDYGGICLPN